MAALSAVAGRKELVYGGLEAPDVFHGEVVSVAGLEVLVENGKDLVVEDLELTDAVDHLLEGLKQVQTHDSGRTTTFSLLYLISLF